MAQTSNKIRKFCNMLLLMAIILIVSNVAAIAALRLPSIIGSNMVLQQEQPIPVWGWAEPGENITIIFDVQRAATFANKDGKWMIQFNPMPAGGPYEMDIIGSSGTRIALQNILIGEVWVASGQSNMRWTVIHSANPDEEIASAEYPNIRLFRVEQQLSHEPLDNCFGEWEVCSPRTIPRFSACAYYFGRKLHKDLNVPVGLIRTTWGGSAAEAWTTLETIKSHPELRSIADRFGRRFLDFPAACSEHKEKYAEWEKARAAGEKGVSMPYPPPFGFEAEYFKGTPGGMFNGMIMPLVPYGIRGAIWYQGESNSGGAYQYRTLFPSMIQDWRHAWGQGDFPFLFVQLPNFRERKSEPSESDWAELCEAQLKTLSLQNTGMAITIDIGEENNIHPKNKQEAGRRLALVAEATVYGKDIVYSGPLYKSMIIDGGKARIQFTHTGSGLVVKDGWKLKGFAIAGRDRKLVWADARIEGDEVVVWSDSAPEPVAVRYAWADNPECNLYNREGLPASPFRTDNWRGITVRAR